MYEVVSDLLEVFSAIFQGYCLQYFFGSFLETRIRNRHAGLLTVVLYAVLKLGIDLILPSDYGSIRSFEKLTLTLCILVVLIVCCYRVAGKIKVFLVVVFLAASEISFFMAYNVCWLGSYLYPLWAWCFKKGYITSVDVFEKSMKATTFGIPITMHIVSIVILFISLKSISRSFREKDYAIHQMELLFILAPSMTGVFICTLLRMVLVTIESGTPVSLYDKYPSLIIMVPIVLLLSFLPILFGIKLFQDMIKEIQRDMKVQTGKDIPEHEVMKVLLKEESNLPVVYTELIHGIMLEKIHSLELELSERGYDMDYINIIYVGGGALMARGYAGQYRSHTAYDCDLCANAKGYEFLAGQMMGKKVG